MLLKVKGMKNQDLIINTDHIIAVIQDGKAARANMINGDKVYMNFDAFEQILNVDAMESCLDIDFVEELTKIASEKEIKETLHEMSEAANRKLTPGKEMQMDRLRKIIDKYQKQAIERGVDTEKMHIASINLKDAAKQATMGAFKKIDCFEALGIAVLYYEPAEELFDEVVEALRNIEEGPKKGALMEELFGPECITMIPLCAKKRG